VITADLAVLDELREDLTVRLVLLGGVLRRGAARLAGSLTQLGLEQLNADLLMLSCTGVRSSGRVVDDVAVEVPVKRAMIEAADQVVLLAGEAQMPGTGSFRVCSLQDVAVLVTTAGADPATTERCRAGGTRVVLG
jgi:DeoR/GlpR family transcriptional regulator of sugar metabolism